MRLLETLVCGAWALFVGALVLERSVALDDAVILDPTASTLRSSEVHSCQDLSGAYDAESADIVVRVKGDVACDEEKTVRASGKGTTTFSFQHAAFTNVHFIVDEEASVMFVGDSVRFDVETPGQHVFNVRGNLDFVAGAPSPYSEDFVDGTENDVHGLVQASSSAKIHVIHGTARYSETWMLVESPLPVHPSDEVMVGKDASSPSQLSNHRLDQLSLEQSDQADLLSDRGVLGSADVDSEIDSDIVFDTTTATAEQQSLDDTVEDSPLVDVAENPSPRSKVVTIATCDDLADSYASTSGREIALIVISDTITCREKKVVHIVGDGVVNLAGAHVTLYNVNFVVGDEATLSFIAQSVKFDGTQEPRTPILEVYGMLYVFATRVSPHHVDSWKEDRQGLLRFVDLGDIYFARGHLTYTDTVILLEGTLPPYDANWSTSELDSNSAESAGTDDALPSDHDAELPDFTAADDEVSEVPSAGQSPDAHGCCEGDVAAEESSEDDGALMSEIPEHDGDSSVDMSPPPSPPTGEDDGDASVDKSAKEPSPEDDTNSSENSSAKLSLSPQLSLGVKEVGTPTGCSEDGEDSCMGSTTPTAVPAAAATVPVQSHSGRVEADGSEVDSTRTITGGHAADGVSSVKPVDLQRDGMMADIENMKQFATPVPVHVSEGSSEEITAPASPDDSGDNDETEAASDSGELSPPSPSTSLPPFFRPGPIKAGLPSLKVGLSLKLPERLVSPQGAAAISLGPDGSIMSSKISQTSAAPAEAAPQQEKEGGDAEQDGTRDETGEFLVSSNWRKVSRVLKERDYSRSRAAATEPTERADKVSERMVESRTGEGDSDIRGKVRDVGAGASEGNRWWNWKGKGRKTHRREKRRFWGARARDAQRRQVPSPDAAKGEDVVMGITDKAVIEVKMDGVRVLSKAGPSKFELINKFRCLMRQRCDSYEALAQEDGGIAVLKEDGGVLYRITGPDDF